MSDPAPPPRRHGLARAIGELAPRHQRQAFRKFGFLRLEIVNRWPEVVGAEFARHCLPAALRFPAGSQTGGTLTIHVDGPFGLHLTHVEPQLIERVNRFFGYAAVVRVRLVQTSLPSMGGTGDPRTIASAPSPGEQARLEAILSTIDADSLRSAMARLGEAVLQTPET